MLIGLEVMILTFTGHLLLAGLLTIPLVLAARWLAVFVPVRLMQLRRTFTPHALKILTWGGLRGGISVALALSIPATAHGQPIPERDTILAITYAVVVFSIIIQGLSIGPLIRRWRPG